MKELNKLIIKKIIEINVLIIFLIGSYPLWQKVHKTIEYDNLIANSTYTYLEIENPINYYMLPMKDEIAFDYLKPCHIEVKNIKSEDVNYTLVLKIAKGSTMDPKYLNIRINNNIKELQSLDKVIDNDYIYYIIDQGNILEKEPIYDIIFWLKEDTIISEVNKKLIFNFELIPSTVNI